MSAASSTVEFRVRETPTGDYVAVDEETDTRVTAERKPFAMLALIAEIEELPWLREFFKSADQLEGAEDLFRLFGDHEKMAELMSAMGAVAEQSQARTSESPAEAVEKLRGSLVGMTDKTAAELVSDSRALDEARAERLADE